MGYHVGKSTMDGAERIVVCVLMIKPKFVGGLEVTWPKFSSVDDGTKLVWRLTFLCVSHVIETPFL